MNEFDVVFCGRATPNPKFVLAPKNRWNLMPVAASVNAVVILVWQITVDEKINARRIRSCIPDDLLLEAMMYSDS